MHRRRKSLFLVVGGFLEVAVLPMFVDGSAMVRVFGRYMNEPTYENEKALEKERQITENHVIWTRYAGLLLALGNLSLIGWLARK